MNNLKFAIYDTHSDIFHNLYERNQQNIKDPFKKFHQANLIKGNIKGGIWVVYGDRDFDIYRAYQIALQEFALYRDQYQVVYGLEGLRNVHDLETYQKLYDLGIRHSSLTWNEANHLATGVKGPSDRGLTSLGKTFLDFMIKRQMIIDVSHLNEKSFYDVLDYTNQNIIASHSNAYQLCPHPRNLKDEQLKRIKDVGGYVGVVAARNFVSVNEDKKNIDGLIDHIEYIANIIGIDHVMLGLDMMDFLDDYSTPNSDKTANLDDLRCHGDAQKMIEIMLKRGFSIDEIKKITQENYLTLLKKVGINI